MEIKGRVSVITGAASGIGAACARAFANAGAKVAVVDVNRRGADDVAESIGGLAITCDLADPSSMLTMTEEGEA